MEFEFHLFPNDFVTLWMLQLYKSNPGSGWVKVRCKAGLFQSTAFPWAQLGRLHRASCKRWPTLHTPIVPLETGCSERNSSDNAHELSLLLCCYHKMPGNQAFPKFLLHDKPHSFSVCWHCMACFLPVQPLCLALLGSAVLFSFGKASFILFPYCKSLVGEKKIKGFSEMAIRSLCGLALLGYLSLGRQSIQLNKVKAVLAKFIISTFLRFSYWKKLCSSRKGNNYNWILIMYKTIETYTRRTCTLPSALSALHTHIYHFSTTTPPTQIHRKKTGRNHAKIFLVAISE